MRVTLLSPVLGLLLAGFACKGDETAPVQAPPKENVIRPRSQPIEFVGITVGRTINRDDFVRFFEPLLGDAAKQGQGYRDHQLQPGLFLSVEEDTRTAEQLIVRLDMTPADAVEGDKRTVLRAPASFAYGEIFSETVQVALATAEERGADMRPFELSYRSNSVRGGHFEIKVDYKNGVSKLYISTENPRTSLTTGLVNQPAFEGEPFETIAGTVWFELSRSEFDFFSTRAYGITAGFKQNFSDFELQPHNWLRLTVKPLLSQEMVDVNFDVVTLDGRRIPFARAPASLLAGEQFQKNVLRLVQNMNDQEAAAPGSGGSFVSPFHYDDPEGGGVVKVIAQGESGVFQIAYAVESPTRFLKDVEFVAYSGKVTIPTDIPDVSDTCEGLGSTRAPVGRFRLVFDASTTVRNDRDLKAPLAGRVVGSVFRAEDVSIRGPREGASAVHSFDIPNVDVRGGPSAEAYDVPVDLPAGEYQILGYMDIDGNAAQTEENPDVGDPVFIPIGAYKLECALQPVTVEFAILLPEGL